MACQFNYKGRQFNSEEDVVDYIEEVKPEEDEVIKLKLLMKTAESGVTEEDLAKQDDLIKSIQATSTVVTKKEDGYYKDGVKVTNRVTDKSKKWLTSKFGESKLSEDEYDKAIRDLKAEEGTQLHAIIEKASHFLIDNKGNVRDKPLDDTSYYEGLSKRDRAFYNILRDNLEDRIQSFPQGTRFLTETIVYDATKDEAGTIDFIAITPKGKVSIIDWKSVNLDTKKNDDLPGYKQNLWKIQIGEYKSILSDKYGIPRQDFDQTRAIPIITTFSFGNRKIGELPQLKGIKIGAVNPKEEELDYLLPVALPEESSGDRDIDELLSKLQSLEKQIVAEKVTDGRKDLKAEQIQALQKAIRKLQVQGSAEKLIDQAELYNKRVTKTLDDYDAIKHNDPKAIKDKDLSKMADEFDDADLALNIYATLDILFKDLTDEKQFARLQKVAQEARIRRVQIDKAEKDFVEKFVAGKRDVEQLLQPERVIKGLQKSFTSLSVGATKAMATLWEIVSMTKQRVDFKVDDENRKLEALKKEYMAWAEGKGLAKKNMFDILMAKGKHELVDQYRSSFYTEANTAIEARDLDWVSDNIDIDAYEAWVKDRIKERTQQIEENVYLGDSAARKKEELKKLEEKFSPENALFNPEIKRFPLPKNQSDEYKTLLANKPALDLYHYLLDRNQYFKEIGYTSGPGTRTFLPYVQKGMMEKLVMGGEYKLGESFLQSISVDSSEIGYGSINPLTGKIEDKLPRYFTSAIADPSTDLFKVISLTNSMAIRYDSMSELEGQVRALNRIEQGKDALQTSKYGEVIVDNNGEPKTSSDNSENAKLLEEMTKAVFYGQKYINTEAFDQTIGNLGEIGKKANKFFGVKLFSENTDGRHISATRSIDTINRIFQQKVLGLNLLSSLSNFLGGNFQGLINAGRFFTKGEFVKSEMELTTHALFQTEEGKKTALAFKYFIPFTDNVANEQAKTMSVSNALKKSPSDILMSMMRASDTAVQATIFSSMLKNAVVIDGQLVNARDYLRKEASYQDRYSSTPEARAEIESQFEEKVAKLIEEKGVLNISKIENDELVIPGMNRNNESIQKFRRLSQTVSKDALGNMTDDDARRINLTVMGRSFMMFKNWIPRLAEVRFSGLKHNQALDSYEWGRTTMFMRYITEDFLHAYTNVSNSLKANAKGIKHMEKMYNDAKIEFEKRNGKGTFKMSKAEFYDMVRQNLKSQIRDLILYAGLLAMFLGAKALAPDDDDTELKSYHKFVVRALDKVKDELGFFYTPWGWQSILNGSLFPSVGIFTDIKNIVTNFAGEVYGLTIHDDKVVDENHPIKYTMKALPVFKEMANYMAILWPETAKEYGIRQPTQGRR